MTEVFRANLAAIERRYPGLKTLVDSDLDGGIDPHNLNSSKLVTKEVNHQKGSGLFFVTGVGSGECFDWLTQFLSKESAVFVIVERDWERFLSLCRQRDLRSFIENKRVHFIFPKTLAEFASQILVPFHMKRRASLMKSLTILHPDNLSQDDLNLYTQCERQLRANQDLFSSMTGYRADGLMGLKYFVENIPWIESTPGVACFENVFAGSSAVIASTGPSLGKSISYLRKIQNTHVIIAADASLKILLKAGIRPHFVCSLERELASKLFFEGIDPSMATARLVAFPEVPAAVIEAYPGPKIVAYRKQLSHFYFEQQAPRGAIGAGHSVAHMCLQLASYLGCSEIALVGQDLAFDPDSLSTHAENVAYADWSRANSEDELKAKLAKEKDQLFWMPGNLRERVPTRGYYIVFAWEFGAQVSMLKSRVTNCTDGGMQIPHVPWQQFDQWISATAQHSSVQETINKVRAVTVTGNIDLTPLVKVIRDWESHLLSQSSILRALGSQTSQPPDGDRVNRPFLIQALSILQKLHSDHVIEAFAQDILGKEVVAIEEKLWGVERPEDLDGQSLKALSDYFETIASGLSDSRSVLTQTPKSR